MGYNTLNKIESMSPQFFLFYFKVIRRESPPLEKNANKHKRDDRKALFHNHHSNT